MKIQVNSYYMHNGRLVRVIGAANMTSLETLRYIIQWTDNGNLMTDKVRAADLSRAPTLPELHDNYMTALHVIAEQARRIEALEDQLEHMATQAHKEDTP